MTPPLYMVGMERVGYARGYYNATIRALFGVDVQWTTDLPYPENTLEHILFMEGWRKGVQDYLDSVKEERA